MRARASPCRIAEPARLSVWSRPGSARGTAPASRTGSGGKNPSLRAVTSTGSSFPLARILAAEAALIQARHLRRCHRGFLDQYIAIMSPRRGEQDKFSQIPAGAATFERLTANGQSALLRQA